MERVVPAVDSKAIVRIEWHDEVLSVWFISDPGRRYRYFDVPRGLHEAFLRADSKGAFFAETIRDRFDWQ
jgi:hypothetical protein